MIGNRPKFLDSPYFYEDADGYHLKPGAPPDVRQEFDEFMHEDDETENPPTIRRRN